MSKLHYGAALALLISLGLAACETAPVATTTTSSAGAAHAPVARRIEMNVAGGYSAAAPAAAPMQAGYVILQEQARDRFAHAPANPVRAVASEPVSTFSADVDTASYAVVRRFLRAGQRPPQQAVRIEEMINYFDYGYTRPASADRPFSIDAAVMPAPWRKDASLLRVALQGFDLPQAQRARANIVLLIDVSGSMDPQDRLPLAKSAIRLLVRQLQPEDTVAIVTYAGTTGVALPPTPASNAAAILSVVDALKASGGTAGGAGLQLAYQEAEKNFQAKAINRVMLMTDGDFNLGITDPAKLKDFIAEKRKTGVYLSVFGFGTGNLNDGLMQMLAQSGNGIAAYIDSLTEARRTLIDELAGSLFPIADDVKIQVEFNPVRVAEYRLIGYETRSLRREDFKNDAVDAGEVGSGHRVTALYEIVAPDSAARLIDPLRYGTAATPAAAKSDEIAHICVRYKRPSQAQSEEMVRAVTADDVFSSVARAPADLRFVAAVAGFGQLLRNEPYTSGFNYADVASLADAARGMDAGGYRAEFVQLVRDAGALAPVAQQSRQ